MTASAFDLLVVGAGHAGSRVVLECLAGGFAGTIGILSRDPHPPYERPPLSKAFLRGECSQEDLLIRPLGFWEDAGVTLLLGDTVSRVRAGDHLVRTTDGRVISYGQLVWAAGASPRRLGIPGEELRGVNYLRGLDDALAIRESAIPGSRHVVVGGGFIGLEAAAVLRSSGVEVTVVESQDRVLSRVAGTAISQFFDDLHRDAGVDIRLRTQVRTIDGQGRISLGTVTGSGDGGTVGQVRVDSGEILAADAVLVGVGVTPNVEPLAEAGALCGNGVTVNAFGATSLDDVYAAGDCTWLPFEQGDGPARHRIRLESIQNAGDQAKTVAAALLGNPQPYLPQPWFWSHQYDVNFKTVGVSTGHDHAVLRGDPAGKKFSVVYLQGGRVIAVDCVNSMRDYVQGRSLIGQHFPADSLAARSLADPNVPLAEVAARAAVSP